MKVMEKKEEDIRLYIHDHLRVLAYVVILAAVTFALFSNGPFKIEFADITGSSVNVPSSVDTNSYLKAAAYFAVLCIVLCGIYFHEKVNFFLFRRRGIDAGLAEYMLNAKEKGFSRQQIMERLASAGWKAKQLKEAFSEMKI